MKKRILARAFWNPQRKLEVAAHFSEMDKNASVSIFSEKEGKHISSQIFLEFAFTHRNAYICIKIFKLHGKCNISHT